MPKRQLWHRLEGIYEGRWGQHFLVWVYKYITERYIHKTKSVGGCVRMVGGHSSLGYWIPISLIVRIHLDLVRQNIVRHGYI